MTTKNKKMISVISSSTSKTSKYLSLEDAKQDFLLDCRSRNLSPYTIENYEKAIRYFQQFVEDKKDNIYDLQPNDIKRWLVYLNDKGTGINSVRAWIKCLKIFLKYFNIDMSQVGSLQKEHKILEAYTDEEIKTLLTKPRRHSFGQLRDYTIVCFLLGTGVRTSTLINIKVKHIDIKSKTLFLEKTKTRKQYTIPLSTTLIEVLKEYLALWTYSNEDYLFPNVFGEQLTPVALRQAIREYHTNRGIKSCSLHKYRRTFATMYLQNNGNIFYLQMLMGHSDISTTRQYCSVNIEDLQKNYDSLNPLDNLKRKGIKLKNS